jgi:GNAT superfamily N-acetyltransferase
MEIATLQREDVPSALRLSTQAGWNQLAADWQRLVDLWPQLALVGKVDGEVAATATLARYGDVAWVGMVLVDESFRGRGLGGKIMNAIIAKAGEEGINVLGLDATDLGKLVYANRGIIEYVGVDRRVLSAADREPCKSPAERVNDREWPALLALDRSCFGMDRSVLLDHLRHEAGARCEVVRERGKLVAFGFRRLGRTAEQIGPVVGRGQAVESVIASLAAPSNDLPVMIDTFRGGKYDQWLTENGFNVKRQLTRMWRGGAVSATHVVAGAGLELG